MGKLTRRGLMLGTGAALGAVGTRYFYRTPIPSGVAFPILPKGGTNDSKLLDDAGELSPTLVAKHIVLNAKPDEVLLAALRTELKEAQGLGRPVVAHTARHSMGGQSLINNGLALTFDQDWIEPDTGAKTYRVAAGTRWSTVIRELDKIGFSPAVMQSNNDFGVASTYSVNAHGWPVAFSGGGTTVRSLKMLMADGNHVTCSRTENADLFSFAMGGYGLFGIITELEVDMVPNANLEPTFETMPGEEFGEAFLKKIRENPDIQMAYGRMSIAIDGFFDEALMITYKPTADQSSMSPAAGSGFISKISRDIFRQQVNSDRWKDLRWGIETGINPMINSGSTTRNSLINEPVVTLDDKDPTRTDILHEYFVSPSRFAEFVRACKEVIPSSFQELLNITLRFVDTDKDSVLAYATEPRIAAVMLFSQEKSLRAEADMARMTSELIERVLAIGGTYYLPYRPHATLDQFKRGYARNGEFVAKKRLVDPTLTFRNGLWENYLAKI
jgi:FAD/FMN-containing dehydrogenase